ncbi:MAG: transposase family protein, partial [Tannerella sp.]|nr:transposase family protein [Tannerella sp.]
MKTSNCFSEVTDPCVTGRCLHLLSDILLTGLCTYFNGRFRYQDMRLSGLECGSSPGDLLSLPHGVPSEDTFERVFKSINPDKPKSCLHVYGNHILTDLSGKQIVTDGKKQRGVSPATRGNRGL